MSPVQLRKKERKKNTMNMKKQIIPAMTVSAAGLLCQLRDIYLENAKSALEPVEAEMRLVKDKLHTAKIQSKMWKKLAAAVQLTITDEIQQRVDEQKAADIIWNDFPTSSDIAAEILADGYNK